MSWTMKTLHEELKRLTHDEFDEIMDEARGIMVSDLGKHALTMGGPLDLILAGIISGRRERPRTTGHGVSLDGE